MNEWRARKIKTARTLPESALTSPTRHHPADLPQAPEKTESPETLWQRGLVHCFLGQSWAQSCPAPAPREPTRKGSVCSESRRIGKASRLTRRLPDQWFSNFPSKDHFCGQKTSWASHPTLSPADPRGHPNSDLLWFMGEGEQQEAVEQEGWHVLGDSMPSLSPMATSPGTP